MIIAKIDDTAFRELVVRAPVIAFQELEFGYAIASPSEAFYAPINHPSGGNFDLIFKDDLAAACLQRMSNPHLRTLRPTAKPIPTQALVLYLMSAFGAGPEPMSYYAKAPGDRPEVIESECQVVIQAIEEFERPDLREAMKPAKRDALSDALDLVIEHAEAARELAEIGDYKPTHVKMHIMQATTAMKTCLEMLLKP